MVLLYATEQTNIAATNEEIHVLCNQIVLEIIILARNKKLCRPVLSLLDDPLKTVHGEG